ncbi:Ubiquitin carboxyl-terminal hydrolase 28 [Gracilariopsis chorda]|uniref:Ubiquitin carboxyl-terminal hydrolase n=1 Tax=Gracilariopsis chorda TaxID=448386 RepID=A0A2V3IFW0_9FLOR|nr:Ubiquitin carboxyl-terminal hydrolase 28 [Gracilariopsis chorda]|eukprot:PXF40923.1 Ubiquitin carboxyl-terminal hydrolase 28 [Gracilariopsis chorda]
MGADEFDGSWQNKMRSMGFDDDQVMRAARSGATNVADAVELVADRSVSSPAAPPPFDNTQVWPTLGESLDTNHVERFPPIASTELSNLASQTYPQPQFGAMTDARDTLPRVGDSATDAPPTSAAEALPNRSQEDDLRFAIELSRKEQDDRDIARAIQASKQDAVYVASSNPDHDMMRAIQASLRDNQQHVDPTASWQSNAFINANTDLRTSPHQPVGLRNIGNTCYLNSLLQVYYYLPAFRRAIMKYRAPIEQQQQEQQVADSFKIYTVAEKKSETTSEILPDPRDSNDVPSVQLSEEEHVRSFTDMPQNCEQAMKRNALTFVVELQRLFASMALGNRNCVDPTQVTRAMRDSDGEPIVIGAQQDASEFNELFLDMVEKGLNQDTSQSLSIDQDAMDDSSPQRSDSKSPASLVKDLFTIRFRQEIHRSMPVASGINTEPDEPVITSGETTAIIVSATSQKERDLHGGLEDYTLTRIEPSDDDTVSAEQNRAHTLYLEQWNVADNKEMGNDQWNEENNKGMSNNQTNVEDNNEMNMDQSNKEMICSTTDSELQAPTKKSRRAAATKSVWFTALPPVVVIYLQRVQYNRSTLQADKVHDRYDFPLEIAFDRYMEENRKEATLARHRVRAIKAEKERLNTLLEHYQRFPLEDTQDAQEGSSATQEPRAVKHPYEDGYFSAASRVQKRLREALDPSSSLYKVEGLSRESIEASLGTLGKILDHDRHKCDGYERELKAVEPESNAYRGLSKLKYKLHAVLVHDGAPESGHYWVFIRDWNSSEPTRNWMKLSDSMVSFLTDEEMYAFSAGGSGRASAYCLIYISCSQPDDHPVNIADESKELLPKQRIEEVMRMSSDIEVVEQDVYTEEQKV